MADFTTPSPSGSTQLEKKWTVSPEFGDALLTAMRERSQTGGPLPRLPSMLQLPPPETPKMSTLPSTTKPDSAERLKMKTRIAIRDRDPHRFQVVPLREADNYSESFEQKHSRQRQPLDLAAVRGSKISQAAPHSWKKTPVNENDLGVKIDTSEPRPMILSERNRNVPAKGVSSSLSDTASRPDASRVAQFNIKQPKQRPNPTSNTELTRKPSHFKSPSLGNLRTKPNLNIDLEAAPLPRVTSCRKRTNTLSAEPRRVDRVPPAAVQPRNEAEKKDSLKRHAIYTQSLYVPVYERPSLLPGDTSSELSNGPSPLRAFPFRSSISASRSKFGSALGFVIMDSQPSLSSIYSQDGTTRPLTYCCPPSSFDLSHLSQTAEIVNDEPIKHHPIILELLGEVEKAIQEWSVQ